MDRNSPIFFLLSLILCAVAQGAVPQDSPSEAQQEVQANAAKPLYTGTFPWKGQSLQFSVGSLEQRREGRSRFVATIKNKRGEIQATCERIILGEAPFDVNSMTLSCKGRIFGKPSRKSANKHLAKFSFADGLPHPKLMIQSQEVELTGI